LSWVASCVALAAIVVACGTKGGGTTADAPDGGDADGSASAEGGAGITPTFHKDIEPILQGHCQGCHVKGGVAPVPLVTYADAQPFVDDIVQKAGDRTMPPWGARTTAECKPRFGWKNDPTLTDAQIKTFSDWAAAGAPEGDPKDAPPPRDLTPISLPNPTLSLTPPAPFALAGQNDEFRCFVLDPKIATDSWMNGLDIIPGNRTIVHHVLVFTVAGGAASITQPLDASGSYDCFGGIKQKQANMIGAWAPGELPYDLPSNIGTPIKAGSAIVIQVHYHPHADASTAPDATTVKLRTTTVKPQYTLDLELLGNFDSPVANGTGLLPDPDDRNGMVEFRIPAGAASHTETMQYTVPTNLKGLVKPQVYLIGAHMHLVGVDEQVTISRAAPINGDPLEECLLAVPQWDFNWQRGYVLDADLSKLPYALPGDVVTVRCRYDNTMQNPALAAALLEQGLKSPSDVTLGETTLDEMCLAIPGVIYLTP
jgi:hypothetical protein